MTEDIHVIDDGFDGENFLGVDLAEVRKVKKAAKIGYMAFPLYPPPAGAHWGEFNNRKMEEDAIEQMLVSFKGAIDFCSDLCAIDVAVKRHWVENIGEALADSVEGFKMHQLPVVTFSEQGKKEILPRNLWMLSGNHRRETLKRYVDELVEEIKELHKKIKDIKGGKTEAELSTDKNWEIETVKAAIAEKQKMVDKSKKWVVRLYDRGA